MRPWIEEGALIFTLGCCHPCSGKAVLKGPGATHHFTLFFCHPNELPGRDEGDHTALKWVQRAAGTPSGQGGEGREV